MKRFSNVIPFKIAFKDDYEWHMSQVIFKSDTYLASTTSPFGFSVQLNTKSFRRGAKELPQNDFKSPGSEENQRRATPRRHIQGKGNILTG